MNLLTSLLASLKTHALLYAVGGVALVSLGASGWWVTSTVLNHNELPDTTAQTATQEAEAGTPKPVTSQQPASSSTPPATPPPTATTSTPKPTTTAKSSASSTPKTATPATPAPAPSASCPNPVFTTSSTNGGWSTNGYYVHNNMWNVSGYNVAETLFACSYKNWYVTATADNNSGDGAVKTYPNVHKDYSGRTIASFSSLTSSFAATTPSVGIYNVAYDIWINGVPNDEVMIWTDNFNQYPGGSKVGSNISLSGYTWDLYASGGNGYIAFVPSGGARIKSGTLDLKAMLNYLVSTGRRSSSDTVDQICYGVEIVSTGGKPATFSFTNFTLSE